MNPPKLFSIVVVALLAGCNNSPPQKTTDAANTPNSVCGNLVFVQDGHAVPSDGNFVSLLRRPFFIYFSGQGDNPTFHASPQATLAMTLKKNAQPEIWNMAGNGLASEDEEILTKREFAILGNEKFRTQYASHLGANYPDILRKAIASRPQVTLLGEIPQNPFRFFDNASKRPVAKVSKIDGQAVENTTLQNVYLVSFAIQEKVAPLLHRTNWKSCEVRFAGK